MTRTMNATDNPHVRAVIERRKAGEPSTRAYQCGFMCGWFAERPSDGLCDCGGPVRMAWGYWGACDEFEGNDAWFYPLSLIRDEAAAVAS